MTALARTKRSCFFHGYAAPGRYPSSYQEALFELLRFRNGLERKPSPRIKRRAVFFDRSCGFTSSGIEAMERLLAAECEAMRQTTKTYQHTINGLLQKRSEMMEELAVIRERMAAFSNDVEALDRVLERLGYDGDIQLTPLRPACRAVLSR